MIINFNEINENVIPKFKGGEKEFKVHMFQDEKNKIMKGRLEPGASIGFHKHETNSEVIYFIKGRGKVLYNDTYEEVKEGMCHYCPKGESHSLINDSDEELVFFAVVPEHESK